MMFNPQPKRRAPEPVEHVDDGALYGRVSVTEAKSHLAGLSAERRAELEKEWK